MARSLFPISELNSSRSWKILCYSQVPVKFFFEAVAGKNPFPDVEVFDLAGKALYKYRSVMDDQFYMMLAIKEAKRAEAMDEVPVGAVVVDETNKVIGHGFNQPISTSDPTSHAEINAIRMAAENLGNYRLTGASLYVTIEPCIMCMGAIIQARIKRLVFGAGDPKWGAVHSLYEMADDPRLNHRLNVTSGVCEEITRNLIKGFFRNKRSK